MTTETVARDEQNTSETFTPTVSTANNNPTQNNPNSIAAPVFDLAKPFEFTVQKKTPKGVVQIFHKLRRPNYSELEAKDASQPYRSQDIGNGKEQPILDLSNKADVKLYDAVILETRGYSHNVEEGQGADEREKALESIPRQHKVEIVGSILKFNSKVEYESEDDIDVFTWGENIEYTVNTEIGANAQFTVTVVLREPNDKQMTDYRRDTTNFVIDKEQASKPITEVSVKLKPAVELFNALVVRVENVTINGEAFDTNNPSHIEQLDAYLKRSALDAMMKALQLDLGN